MNLAANGTAQYKVQVEVSEAADVWLVAYRNFSALGNSSAVQPGVVTKRAPSLDMPACTAPAVAATMDAFKPCNPIAYMQSRTDRFALNTTTVRHIATFNVAATIWPGLAAVQNLEAKCQYKHLFGLSSSAVDFHLVARDIQPPLKQFKDECSMGPAIQLDQSMWKKNCKCAA
jgi:hypothetical protein